MPPNEFKPPTHHVQQSETREKEKGDEIRTNTKIRSVWDGWTTTQLTKTLGPGESTTCISTVHETSVMHTVQVMSNPQPSEVRGAGYRYRNPDVRADAVGNNYYLGTVDYELPDLYYDYYGSLFPDHEAIQQCKPWNVFEQGYYDILTRGWYVSTVSASSTRYDDNLSPVSRALVAPPADGGPLPSGIKGDEGGWRTADSPSRGEKFRCL